MGKRLKPSTDGAGDPVEGFRAPQVMKVVGITYRQLDHWARTGLVEPSVRDATGSGSQRVYSFSDIALLRMIKKLLDAGQSLQQIRKAITYIREDLKQPLEDVTLVSDGTTIYACTSPNEIIDLLAGGQGVLVTIAMGKVYEEMHGNVAQLRTRPEGGSGGDTTVEAGG